MENVNISKTSSYEYIYNNIINNKQIKIYTRDYLDLKFSVVAHEKLKEEIMKLINRAAERAKGNNRNTILDRDF